MSGNFSGHDVLILGGGPAGMSTALWCTELGLSAVLIDEKDGFGGQLLQIHNPVENYLGIRAENGRELLGRFLQQIEKLEITRVLGNTIKKVDLESKSVLFADGTSYSARSMVISTGVKRRRLDVPGEAEFQNRGILGSGFAERELVKDKTVLIIGGGDAALENANILSGVAKKIFVAHRGEAFSARPEFFRSAAESPNVEFLLNTNIESINGTERVISATLCNRISGDAFDLPIDSVLIRIGVEPNTREIRGQVALDGSGYIIVDASCITDRPGIFAAGDVANPVSPTISTATGMGATAAKSIYKWLHLSRTLR